LHFAAVQSTESPPGTEDLSRVLLCQAEMIDDIVLMDSTRSLQNAPSKSL
jgi:hypothetical protein